jgi:uncharacterized protein YcbK (DUF882 family)
MPSFPRLSLRFLAPLALAFFTTVGVAEAKSTRRHATTQDDAPAEKIHTVGPGQTLAKIAKRYHVSVPDLREVNDLAPGQKLHSGMRLVIPSKDKASARDKGDDRERSSKKKGAREVGVHDRHTGGVVKDGHIRLVHGGTSWSGKVFDKKGKIAPKALDAFSRMLASSNGKTHKIEPRLLALVATVSDHFGGRTIEVVSGFRPQTPSQFTPHSRHNAGAAIDMHVRGVDNEELRDFCKTFRNVGVGFYPNSSFIHLDVRTESTTWTDFSKPGEAPRYNRADAAKDAEDASSDPGTDAPAAKDSAKDATPRTEPTEKSEKTEGESKKTPLEPLVRARYHGSLRQIRGNRGSPGGRGGSKVTQAEKPSPPAPLPKGRGGIAALLWRRVNRRSTPLSPRGSSGERGRG